MEYWKHGSNRSIGPEGTGDAAGLDRRGATGLDWSGLTKGPGCETAPVDPIDALDRIVYLLDRDLAPGHKVKAFLRAQTVIAELPDGELDALVSRAVAETGATSPRDMGKVIKHVMAAADGRAEGRGVSIKVKEALIKSENGSQSPAGN